MAKKKVVQKKVENKKTSSDSKLSIKEKAKSFLELIRVGNCLMTAIAVVIGFYLASGADYRVAAIAAMSGFLICGAGQAINDYFDANIDAKTSKHRPIPSGRIEARRALLYSVSMFFLGIFASFFINPSTVIIALVFAVLLIAYPLFMNKIKYLGNVIVALGTAITFVYGASAAGNITALIIFLAISAFLSNMGREITKDIEDVKKDKGEKSTIPLILGTKLAKGFVLVYYALSAVGAIAVYVLFQYKYQLTYYLPFTLLSIGLFFYALFLLNNESVTQSQKVSKIAMLVSLIAFILIGF